MFGTEEQARAKFGALLERIPEIRKSIGTHLAPSLPHALPWPANIPGRDRPLWPFRVPWRQPGAMHSGSGAAV